MKKQQNRVVQAKLAHNREHPYIAGHPWLRLWMALRLLHLLCMGSSKSFRVCYYCHLGVTFIVLIAVHTSTLLSPNCVHQCHQRMGTDFFLRII